MTAAEKQAAYAAHRRAWKDAYRALYQLPPEEAVRSPGSR